MDKEIYYDQSSHMIIVRTDEITIPFTIDEITRMNELANTNIRFREDVEIYLQERVENDELDEEFLSNNELISDMLDRYTELRDKYDGNPSGLNWQECLDEAWEDIDLDDYTDGREV